MGSYKETNCRVRRELQFKGPTIFSDNDDLCLSIRYERTGWWARLTRDCELVLCVAPILIEKRSKVDGRTCLSVLRPK